MPQYTYNGVTVTATRRRPSSRDDKKYERTVTIDGTDYLVHYGDPNMEMQRDNPERRANFLSRHNCSEKKDPKAPGYWACLDWARTSEGKSVDDDGDCGCGCEDCGDMNTGNALKAISSTDTELRVGNYMVLFGGRDLEGLASPRKNRDGSIGEYFTKNTVFESPYTEIDMLAVDWEHGYEELPKDEVFGRVDWKTARVDERGLFVERILNRRNRYVQWIEQLIDAGLVGNSSEAIHEGVVKGEDGELKSWPLRRDTLTMTPMEPRMLNENVITAVKALSQRYPALAAMIPNVEVSMSSPDGEAEYPEAGAQPADSVPDGEDMMMDDARRIKLEIELELVNI